MMKKLATIASVLLTFNLTVTQAQPTADQVNSLTASTPPIQIFAPNCVVSNMSGSITGGFLGFAAGIGTHAILIDPTGSGAAGDPGCGGDFTNMLFDVDDITFQIADETAFSAAGDGLGTVTYEVSIHPFLVSGDPTMGPAPAIVTETQVFTADASAVYTVTTPFTAQESLTEPFFVSWKLISFASTNAGVVNTVSTLWDAAARPLGRQFIDNDGTGFVDHSNFFTAPANGWVSVVVNGNFRSAVTALAPPTPVPSLTWLGLALMILTLGFFGRRFVK